MNERPKLGGERDGPNVHLWVWQEALGQGAYAQMRSFGQVYRSPKPAAHSPGPHGRCQPMDNAFVESFDCRLRDDCLNTHWFLSLGDAQANIEAWRRDYNESPPYTSLSWLTPVEYAAAVAKIAAG